MQITSVGIDENIPYVYHVVKENCSVDYGGASPNDDLMERLLNARKG